jgi:hypothetical protein
MKPYLYFCSAIARTCSAVSTVAAIHQSPDSTKKLKKSSNILIYNKII